MSFLVIANWKMNGSFALLSEFVEKLQHNINYNDKKDLKIIICPPFTALEKLSLESDNFISLGAQNCFYQKNGPYTGEISPNMLYDCGCRYVIIGHSERRQIFNETNQQIKLKAESAISAGLIPIICIGENLSDRENNNFKQVLLSQCEQCLPKNGQFIIAYEPVWAIGKNSLPNIKLINETIGLIKPYSSKIVYGGSVNQHNINEVMTINNISGILVGGASLDFSSFYDIILSVKRYKVLQ